MTATTPAGTQTLTFDEQREDGTFYRFDEAAPGWLISEPIRGGDLRFGLITQVHGGGFSYRDEHGADRFVAMRHVYTVACPVNRAT